MTQNERPRRKNNLAGNNGYSHIYLLHLGPHKILRGNYNNPTLNRKLFHLFRPVNNINRMDKRVTRLFGNQ